jgi:hypothetical protein
MRTLALQQIVQAKRAVGRRALRSNVLRKFAKIVTPAGYILKCSI